MTPDDPRHGTPRGYFAHRREGEDACTPCRNAAARYECYRELEHMAGRPLLVDREPTVRRIRALQTIGWPTRTIGRRLGHDPSYVSVLLHRPGKIRRAVADEVARIYSELCMTPGPSDITRVRAAARGWAPPLAWDDIDTDQAPIAAHLELVPNLVDDVVVRRILDGDARPARTATPAERRAIVTAWPTTGRSLSDLARLTGWKPERYTTQTPAAVASTPAAAGTRPAAAAQGEGARQPATPDEEAA